MRDLFGEKRLTRQRMDFLLLLPHGRRIVIDVDDDSTTATVRVNLSRTAMQRWSLPIASSASTATRSIDLEEPS